jgi:hypothetical protein
MTPNSLSEQYRLIGIEWVELDHAARLLEATKSAVLSQRMAALGDMPVSRAEQTVKASDEWQSHVTKIEEARTAANIKKIEMETIRMQFSEQQSREATDRAERRM